MPNLSSSIKLQIYADLQALVTSNVLGQAVITNFTKDVLDNSAYTFPFAILENAMMKSEPSDNQNNERTYVYQIFIVQKKENISTVGTDIENMLESILNKLDTDFTLQGTAIGGSLPATVEVAPYNTPDKSLIVARITLSARTLYQLGQ